MSWTATSLLIVQAWTRGEVPAHYAEHTLDIARQAVDEARAAPHAARALALITRAQDAVRAHDAGAARATLAQLEAVAHLQ